MTLLGCGKPPAAGGPTYDADAQAIFDEMTTPPDETRKGVIEDLVLALKADGIWSKCDAIYVLAAHDSQASKINWKNPTETELAETATTTFTTDRGWASNGSSGVLTMPTNLSAYSQYVQNSGHVAIWSRTSGSNANIAYGYAAGAATFVRPRNAGDVFSGRVNSATSINVGSADGSGLFMVTRSGASATQMHRNGAQVGGTETSASTAPVANPLTIGGGNGAFSTIQIAFASVGADLTSESADYYTAVAAYMTAVGA